MIRLVSKNLSYDLSKEKSQLSSLTYRDFFIFRSKFCGIFVIKGKKSYSLKVYNYILLKLKKLNVYKNPFKLFFLIIKKITPFLTLAPKKINNNLINVPSLLFGNKKILLLLNWIARQLRNKSNVYGINKEDVLKNIIDAYNFKGLAFKMKEEHNKKIILARINMKNEGIEFNRGAIKKWDKLNRINSKYQFWKDEIERLNEDFDEKDVEEEFIRWKEEERKYKFLKSFKRSVNSVKKKNKKIFIDYRKSFVK